MQDFRSEYTDICTLASGDGVKMMLRTCDESWSSPGQVFTQNLLNEETEDFDERIRASALRLSVGAFLPSRLAHVLPSRDR